MWSKIGLSRFQARSTNNRFSTSHKTDPRSLFPEVSDRRLRQRARSQSPYGEDQGENSVIGTLGPASPSIAVHGLQLNCLQDPRRV